MTCPEKPFGSSTVGLLILNLSSGNKELRDAQVSPKIVRQGVDRVFKLVLVQHAFGVIRKLVVAHTNRFRYTHTFEVCNNILHFLFETDGDSFQSKPQRGINCPDSQARVVTVSKHDNDYSFHISLAIHTARMTPVCMPRMAPKIQAKVFH